MEPRTQSLFNSYREYLATLVETEIQYQWLHEFFAKRGAQPSETSLVLADSIDNRIQIRDFSSDLAGFQQKVEQRSSDIQTRIVLIWYKETWSVDREIVDKVSLTFDINAAFLWEHFEHLGAKTDRLNPIDKARWEQGPEIDIQLLASENDSMVISDEKFRMSALFQNYGGRDQTIIVFARADFSFIPDSRLLRMSPSSFASGRTKTFISRSSAAYENLLLALSIEDVAVANSKPVEFIYPYAHLCAMRYSRNLRTVMDQVNWERSSYEDWEIEHLKEYRDLSRKVTSELKSGFRSLVRHSNSDSKNWEKLKSDYDEILAQARQLEQDFKDHMSTYVGIMTFKESKKSIQQAESLRRITQLAFIFVPLTFVSSIFGMNLESFGTGNIKTWLFLTVAITMSLAVFAILIISSHFRKWYRVHFKSLRVILALSQYLPREAFWFAIFCLYHRPKSQRLLFGGLGLYYRLLSNGHDWLPPTAFRAATDTRLSLSIDLSPFWFEKAEIV